MLLNFDGKEIDMRKTEKIALSLVLISVLLWISVYVALFDVIDEPVEIFILLAIVLSILSVTLGIMCIVKRIKKSASSYLTFGIINALLDIAIIIYAVYDIKTDNSWMFNGLKGYLLLWFIAPIPVVLIIVDVIVYFVKKKKKGENKI